MGPFLQRLFQPLNVAAYLAWLAIGAALLSQSPRPTGVVAAAATLPCLLALHLLVLALFVSSQWAGTPRRALARVLAQLAAALAMVAIAQEGVLPILMIIAMAQLAQLLPPRSMAVVFAATNALFAALLWGIWKVGPAAPGPPPGRSRDRPNW